MSETLPVSFEVYYRPDEYVSILLEYALFRRRKRIRENSETEPQDVRLPWSQRTTLRLLGPRILRYKMRKLGTCTFHIDAEQVQRTSKQGTLVIPQDHRGQALHLTFLLDSCFATARLTVA